MAKPDKTIDKIKPDANNTYVIVPTMMTDTNGTYKAELPTLEQDETIVVESQMPKVVRLI